jgi:SAM-dependent methyltransferase
MNMTTVQAHYDQHLGPIYEWMAGGIDAAVARGAAELANLGEIAESGGQAVDLGAGFGMHALPLARLGFRVLAVDTCEALLDTLRVQRGALPIDIVHDELQSFARYLCEDARLVVCMGDTLTHLPDEQSVEALVANIADVLGTDGHFITTFRDYTRELDGTARFIPVRDDAERIHTCFLEYAGARVIVHDLLHELDDGEWKLRVSAYPKLRIAPEWVAAVLRTHGFEVETGGTASGMVQLVARRH